MTDTPDNLENWPIEFANKLIVGNKTSNIGIITLWSEKEKIACGLNRDTYAVIGNFYDKYNGFEPLLRNCLSNPYVRYLIVVGEDKSKSKNTLVQFFNHGLTPDNKFICNTDVKIPDLIPIEDIINFRANVSLIDASGITNKQSNDDAHALYTSAIQTTIHRLARVPPYASPKVYPKQVRNATTFPSSGNVFTINADYIGNAMLQSLNTVLKYGLPTKTTGNLPAIECQNVIITIRKEDPDDPQIQPYYRFDKTHIKQYCDAFFTENIPSTTSYTYGSRLRTWGDVCNYTTDDDQLVWIINKIKANKDTKSAYATTWRRSDFFSNTPPCIISIQATVVGEYLHMTSYTRSNDMFRGWPLNAYGLRHVQKIIASETALKMGELTIVSHSAHIYDENISDANDIVREYYTNTNCFFDDRGYYVISVNGDVIHLKHHSPCGQYLREITGKTCREITDKLYSSIHPTDPYHISYLAEELTKAELCVVFNANPPISCDKMTYVQDAPLCAHLKAVNVD